MRNSRRKCEERTRGKNPEKSDFQIELSRTRKEEVEIIIIFKPINIYMLQTLQTLEQSVLNHIPSLASENELVDYRNSVTGKNGSLTELLK